MKTLVVQDIIQVLKPGDIPCITSNGCVRKDGCCVMGRGIAAQASRLFPGFQLKVGQLIKQHGNRCFNVGKYPFRSGQVHLATFVVKHHWSDAADLELIKRSVGEIEQLADKFGWKRIYLPAPGCGNGRRAWQDVKPLVESLDDRFTIVFRQVPEEF